MPDEEFLNTFHFKAEPSKAIFDLFSRVISAQATLASLKDLVLENLHECNGKSKESLLGEFEAIFEEHKRELLTDFISRYGQVKGE